MKAETRKRHGSSTSSLTRFGPSLFQTENWKLMPDTGQRKRQNRDAQNKHLSSSYQRDCLENWSCTTRKSVSTVFANLSPISKLHLVGIPPNLRTELQAWSNVHKKIYILFHCIIFVNEFHVNTPPFLLY